MDKIIGAEVAKCRDNNLRVHKARDPSFQADVRKGLIYPVLLRPMGEWFEILDGHGRIDVYREDCIPTIDAILVQGDLTQADIRAVQLRIDAHRKGLSDYERYLAVKEIAEANPSWSYKEIGAELNICGPTITMLLTEGIEAVEEAFKEGSLCLAKRYQIAQEKPERQPVMLSQALAGATVKQLSDARKAPQADDRAKHDKLAIAFDAGVVTTRAKRAEEPLALAGHRLLLVAALAKVDSAIREGISARTAAKAWSETRDRPARVRKPRQKREVT